MSQHEHLWDGEDTPTGSRYCAICGMWEAGRVPFDDLSHGEKVRIAREIADACYGPDVGKAMTKLEGEELRRYVDRELLNLVVDRGDWGGLVPSEVRDMFQNNPCGGVRLTEGEGTLADLRAAIVYGTGTGLPKQRDPVVESARKVVDVLGRLGLEAELLNWDVVERLQREILKEIEAVKYDKKVYVAYAVLPSGAQVSVAGRFRASAASKLVELYPVLEGESIEVRSYRLEGDGDGN